MKTDRELLELAAKAVGIDHPGGEHCINGPALWDCTRLRWWRPLTDDGDALRLAVDLSLDLHVNARAIEIFSGDLDDCVTQPCIDGDKRTAARRAIVRAAAVIGEAMQ